MEKIEREDTLSVPFKALRESVLNLLAHRCWDAYNLTPSVAIYEDRIEFQNPGHLPIGNTYQDLTTHLILHLSIPSLRMCFTAAD